MTQFFAYANSALGNTHIRLNGSVHDGIPGVTQNADGTIAQGGATIDDPTGAFSMLELQEFTFDETACSRLRVFTGFLTNMRVTRGPYRTGPGRIYDFDLIDLNYLLHLEPFTGATAKRPAETANARMTWLLGTLTGVIWDSGLVASNTLPFDAADYTDQYPDAVLSDLVVADASNGGLIFFVYRDNATGHPSLFYDLPTASTYTSTLSISNTNADLSATCYPPFEDAQLEASGEDIYCGVVFKYVGGQIYSHNATTHATYFAGKGYHRTGVFETTRIGKLATATAHAATWLANHAGTLDTVTCMIQVPSSQVNLLEAGMRVSCKFSDLQGYEGPIYLRVSSRTVVPTAGNPDLYDLHLSLSNRSLTPVAGGGTGGFPNPPTQPPGVVQHKGGPSTVILDTTPVDGDLLLIFAVKRAGYPSTPAGFSIVQSITNVDIDPGSGNQGYARWFSKTASGESGSYTTGGSTVLEVIEYPAGTTIDANTTGQAADGTVTITMTPSAGGAIVLVGAAIGWFFDPTITSNTDVTTLDSLAGEPPPYLWVAYKNVVTPAATTVGATYTTSPGHYSWGAIGLVLLGTATQNPPVSGQWVGISPPETVVMSGVNGTTQFPFANGSLRVFYDIVEQTAAIVSYDGAAGTFVMPSAPPLGTQVFVQYQAQ